MRSAIAALVVAALAAIPATARVVDYTALNAVNFAAEAASLKITPISPEPVRTGRDITLETTAGVDHEVMTLGNYCSAYKVENPMAPMLRQLFAAASRDPGAAAVLPPLRVTITNARSNQRCVEMKEYNVRCIARVTITGEGEIATEAGPRKFPIKTSIERDSGVGGFCEGRARGIGIISREAGLEFVAAALAAADAPQP